MEAQEYDFKIEHFGTDNLKEQILKPLALGRMNLAKSFKPL